MLYVPRHLPNKLEYKVLSCISVHYQSRMTSNGIAITRSHPLTVQAGQYESYDSVHAGLGWGEEAQNMCTLHAHQEKVLHVDMCFFTC